MHIDAELVHAADSGSCPDAGAEFRSSCHWLLAWTQAQGVSSGDWVLAPSRDQATGRAMKMLNILTSAVGYAFH